jgi:hypothetical protein
MHWPRRQLRQMNWPRCRCHSRIRPCSWQVLVRPSCRRSHRLRRPSNFRKRSPFCRPAPPGVPPSSPAQRLKLDGKERERAERCLANSVYFEARSEPFRGQVAVTQVVLNRVFSPFYPNDICSVVYQNANRRLACQFTFACDGQRDVITELGPGRAHFASREGRSTARSTSPQSARRRTTTRPMCGRTGCVRCAQDGA